MGIPIEIKKLKGTYNVTRDKNKGTNQEPIKALPPPLEGWSDAQKELYSKIGPDLFDNGLMCQVDIEHIYQYVDEWGVYHMAKKELEEKGYTLVATKSGFEVVSPYVGVKNKALDNMMKIAKEYGMTAAARSKIVMDPKKEESALGSLIKPKKIG